MTVRLLLYVVLLTAAGCRLPGTDGPVSRSLATCRQFAQQGVVAMEREQWSDAEQLLAKAVKSCPTDAEARRHYAEALWHAGRRAEAIAQIEEACQIRDEADHRVRLAEMRLEVGPIEAARAHAEQALDLDPKSAAAWAIRGRIAQVQGNARQALADFHRALGLNPSDRAVLCRVAQLYLEQGQPDRALASLQIVAETHRPGEEPADLLERVGQAYMAAGRFDDAAESFSSAIARAGPGPGLLAQLGDAQRQSGRMAEATASVRAALAIDPGHRASLDLLSRLAADGQPVLR